MYPPPHIDAQYMDGLWATSRQESPAPTWLAGRKTRYSEIQLPGPRLSSRESEITGIYSWCWELDGWEDKTLPKSPSLGCFGFVSAT